MTSIKTYVSILRGINVSGKNLIKMESLRKMYEKMQFQYVSSYVQSGNVLFQYNDTETTRLEEKIAKQIEADFGFDVAIIVLTVDYLKKVIENNPFVKDASKDPAFLHVTFLASQATEYNQKAIEDKKQNEEEIAFADKVVYLYCPNGYGRTKLTNTLLESKLKVKATTRNWKTTNELLKLADSITNP